MNGTLCVTFDVEDWYHIPSVCGSPFSVYKDVNDFFKKWNASYDYLTVPTKRMLDLLDEYGVIATFFVVADVASNYPGLIESITDRGHEIACHGLHHECKIDPKTKEPSMNDIEFRTRTLNAKKILEKVSGETVVGYRAPNALIAGWMLDSLEMIRFKYDSSVCKNSLYNKTNSSLVDVSSFPYYPKTNDLLPGEDRGFIEFPWAFYDICGLKIPTSGGPMLRFLGANMMIKGLRQSLKRGDSIFYSHPIDISQESFPKVGKGRPMYWSIKGDIIERRIRHILNNLPDIKKMSIRELVE